jgi:PKD repeat protein
VVHNPPPVASFNATPYYGTAPLNVQFTDTSSGNNIGGWQWNFGDGTGNNTQPDPMHEFNNVGNYTVTLTVSNDGGVSSTQSIEYVQAQNSSSPPVFQLFARLFSLISPVSAVNAQSVIATDISDIITTPQPATGTAMPLTFVNNSTTTQIDSAIDDLSANGGTNIGAGISQAINDLNNSSPGNKKVIILLTDGYSQNPENDIAEAQQAADNNITIDTIGLGMPDINTLQTIASTTGGSYYKASSDEQLQNIYMNIAYNLTANVTTWSNVNMYTNCSQEYGPDTIYVNNSSTITTYNTVTHSGISSKTEPQITDNGNDYNLTWVPGNLSFADIWTVNYQLMLNHSGSIEAINDSSNIQFGASNISIPPDTTLIIDTNGTSTNSTLLLPNDTMITPTGTIVFPNGTLIYLNGTMITPDGNMTLLNGTMILPDGSIMYGDIGNSPVTGNPVYVNNTISLPPDLKVSITCPSDNYVLNNSSQLNIQWNVNYTGNLVYGQSISIIGTSPNNTQSLNVPLDSNYDGSGSKTFTYTWNAKNWPIDNYIITISAQEQSPGGILSDSDSRTVQIPFNPGNIRLS